MTKEEVSSSSVGKCQYCGEIVVFRNFFEWKCPCCEETLDNTSLGCIKSGDRWIKVKQVGPDEEWHDISEKIEDFHLPGLYVKVDPPKAAVGSC